MIRALLIAVAAAACLPGSAAAGPREEFVERARTLLERRPERFRRETEWVRKIESGEVPDRDLEELIAGLGAAMADPELALLGKQLIVDVRMQQQSRAEALAREFELSANSALAKLVPAEHAADLDEVLASIARVQERFRGLRSASAKLEAAAIRLDEVRRLVVAWQDLLWALANGELDKAHRAAESAEAVSANTAAPFPRSKLLDRVGHLRRRVDAARLEKATGTDARERAYALIAQIKSMEELRRAAPHLDQLAWRNGSPAWPGANTFIQSLSGYLYSYDRVREGWAGASEISRYLSRDSGMLNEEPTLRGIRLIMLREALPYLIDPLSTERPSFEDGVAYLTSIWRDALQRQDWDRALRVADALRYANTKIVTPENLAALRSIRAARNFEVAGEFALAVSHYLNALENSDVFAAEAAKEHLAAIRRAHPGEYERGREMALVARPPR